MSPPSWWETESAAGDPQVSAAAQSALNLGVLTFKLKLFTTRQSHPSCFITHGVAGDRNQLLAFLLVNLDSWPGQDKTQTKDHFHSTRLPCEAEGVGLLYSFSYLYLAKQPWYVCVCVLTHNPPHFGKANKNPVIEGHMPQFQRSWRSVFQASLSLRILKSPSEFKSHLLAFGEGKEMCFPCWDIFPYLGKSMVFLLYSKESRNKPSLPITSTIW